jgi:hypothetical protein
MAKVIMQCGIPGDMKSEETNCCSVSLIQPLAGNPYIQIYGTAYYQEGASIDSLCGLLQKYKRQLKGNTDD